MIKLSPDPYAKFGSGRQNSISLAYLSDCPPLQVEIIYIVDGCRGKRCFKTALVVPGIDSSRDSSILMAILGSLLKPVLINVLVVIETRIYSCILLFFMYLISFIFSQILSLSSVYLILHLFAILSNTHVLFSCWQIAYNSLYLFFFLIFIWKLVNELIKILSYFTVLNVLLLT